jgi:adenylate kinase family enzyme
VVYRNETLPVLDFYWERGLLVAVPASGSIECVGQRVLAALGQV